MFVVVRTAAPAASPSAVHDPPRPAWVAVVAWARGAAVAQLRGTTFHTLRVRAEMLPGIRSR